MLLRVLADATKVIPEYCTVYYQTEEDDRGSVNMQKLGRIRDNYQTFTFDGKPFRGILSSIAFDVRGYDHRVRDYRLTVVPSPTIVETKLDCVFPPYMVDEQLSLWLPRTMDLASGTQLPNGTRITLRARANKDLIKVDIRDVQTEQTTVYEVAQLGSDPRQIEYVVDASPGNLTLELTLHDTDGVDQRSARSGCSSAALRISRRSSPRPCAGSARPSRPTSSSRRKARSPTTTMSTQSWFDVVVNDSAPRQFPFDVPETGELDAALDFRAQRAAEGRPRNQAERQTGGDADGVRQAATWPTRPTSAAAIAISWTS